MADSRTSILICLSTTIFIEIGRPLESMDGDQTRALSQLVTGVGFLGGAPSFLENVL